MKREINPRDIILLCDEEQDRELFLLLRRIDPRLSQIPDGNVRTYEQARIAGQSILENATAPLHQDDRPDWIFCIQDSPALVVELTRHAYTGDNGLQRFARFAAAAENGVPFIYFGPLSRVRDDELDGGGRASPRRLTSHLFAGMAQLAAIYGVPQLYVEWPTDRSGLPASLPFRPNDVEMSRIYGPLLDLISTSLFDTSSALTQLKHPVIARAQQNVSELAAQTNTRDTDVVFALTHRDFGDALQSPSRLFDQMTASSNYFHKGKPDKLLAAHALRSASLNFVMDSNGHITAISPRERAAVVQRLLSHPVFRRDIIAYYTGYKWRSDPHCGAFVNLIYRCSRSDPRRDFNRNAFVLLYPRVSMNNAVGIGAALAKLSHRAPGGLANLFNHRYGVDEAAAKMQSCLDSVGLFGKWTNTTKQARLFRRYADVILLNDGIILGSALGIDF